MEACVRGESNRLLDFTHCSYQGTIVPEDIVELNNHSIKNLSTYEERYLSKYSHEQPDQALSQHISYLTTDDIKPNTDMVEEKTSKVVVPLTHKSDEHKGE
jgi:hypothetical protein